MPSLALLLFCAAAAGSRHHGETPKEQEQAEQRPEKQQENRVLVLDLGGDVDEEDRRSITALVAKDIARAGLEVISGDDLRNMVALEGEKQAAGCAGDESCLADIAGALDARLVVSGFVGRLGALTVVNLSLFDAHAARSHGRATVEARNLEELPPKLEAAVDELVHDFLPQTGVSPGLVVAVGGGVGAVVATALAVGGGALFFQHDSARTALLATSAQHEKTQDDGLVVDLADENAAVEDARTAYNDVGVPLLYGAAIVGVVAVGAVVAGVVLLSQDAE